MPFTFAQNDSQLNLTMTYLAGGNSLAVYDKVREVIADALTLDALDNVTSINFHKVGIIYTLEFVHPGGRIFHYDLRRLGPGPWEFRLATGTGWFLTTNTAIRVTLRDHILQLVDLYNCTDLDMTL